MGLREVKKQKVRASIIENAVALFRERGFDATTVREISGCCDVSDATFFNYFPTKDSVLSAWAHGLVAERLEQSGSVEERGLRPVIRGLCDALADAVAADAVFAATAWARARVSDRPPSAAEPLIRAGQASGQLRRDLSAHQMGVILYGAIFGAIADWLARDEPRGPLSADLRRATDLVLDGSRRRNERVRPTSSVPLSTR